MKKMNPIRAKLITEIFGILHSGVDNLLSGFAANKLNQEFMERSRGHGKSRSFIKSVANQRNNTTYFPPEKRNGEKEIARRLRQMA